MVHRDKQHFSGADVLDCVCIESHCEWNAFNALTSIEERWIDDGFAGQVLWSKRSGGGRLC